MQNWFEFLAVSTVFLIYLKYVQAVDVFDCGSYFTIKEVDIEGCERTDTVCDFFIGSYVTVSFTLNTGKFDIDETLVNDVGLVVGSGSTRFNLTATPEDPCEVILCPLEINYTANFRGKLFVSLPRPVSLPGKLQWILRTSSWNQLLCFELSVNVIDTGRSIREIT